uniref:Transmembrane protein 33 n=1 Tax=Phasianus colchicus TaxID=9054 RepID=A0A669PKT8_PHACC
MNARCRADMAMSLHRRGSSGPQAGAAPCPALGHPCGAGLQAQRRRSSRQGLVTSRAGQRDVSEPPLPGRPHGALEVTSGRIRGRARRRVGSGAEASAVRPWRTLRRTDPCKAEPAAEPWLHEAASFYQRALLANALTSALRLHQRLPHFQLSRAFLAQALLEDSCHYLLYSLIFVNSYPVTMSIFPVLLFSLLHAATYTKKVLDARGSNSLPFLRNLLEKLNANQQNILKFIACNEIFLMPATVFMLFSGQGSLLQPFIYYRFLTLRYSSRRNPYCRTLFTELRIVVEHLIMKPSCPVFVRRLCLSSISFISRLAPTAA